MRQKLMALDARRPAIWMTAAVMLAVPAPAIAGSSPPGTESRGADSLWSTDRPTGWSAGTIAAGTGFSRPGASERVREVQRKLNRLGYRAGKVDGLFGPLTEAAVRRFQQAGGLAADGVVGPRTLSELHSRSGRLERLLSEGTGFSKQDGSVRVRDLQRKLNRLGYRAGQVDGLFGPVTARAVRRFQARRGLEVDGVAGPRTLRILETRAEALRKERPQPASVGREPTPRPVERPTPGSRAPVTPSRPPWEGQPLIAKLATLLILGLNVLLVAWLVAYGLRRLSSRAPSPARRQHDPRAARAPAVGSREQAPAPAPIELLGARVSLRPNGSAARSPDTIDLELRLFVESKERHWETDLQEPHLTALGVAVEDLQERVRELVVPERLPRVAAALSSQGVDVRSNYLEEVSFVVELTREVERALLKARQESNGPTVSRPRLS